MGIQQQDPHRAYRRIGGKDGSEVGPVPIRNDYYDDLVEIGGKKIEDEHTGMVRFNPHSIITRTVKESVKDISTSPVAFLEWKKRVEDEFILEHYESLASEAFQSVRLKNTQDELGGKMDMRNNIDFLADYCADVVYKATGKWITSKARRNLAGSLVLEQAFCRLSIDRECGTGEYADDLLSYEELLAENERLKDILSTIREAMDS